MDKSSKWPDLKNVKRIGKKKNNTYNSMSNGSTRDQEKRSRLKVTLLISNTNHTIIHIALIDSIRSLKHREMN